MMHHQAVFWVLLFDVQYAGVKAQTAIWKFPTRGQGLQANAIDTVLLDWTSTLPSTILRMWCKNETEGSNFALASSFFVDSTGPFKYVMETYGNETVFPLSCHAELAADPLGSGFDSPASIVWSSDSAQEAKTISQTQAASSVTVTVVLTPSPSLTPTSALPTSITDTNLSQASPTSSATSTKQLSASSSASAISSASSSASAISSASSPGNTRAIIGGTIGCVALIGFIILAFLFLRKYQRDQGSSAIATDSSKGGFHIFNVYKKRGPKARTTGIFEKEGDCGAHEKEGTRVSYRAWKETMLRGGSWDGGKEDQMMRYSPVELPGGSIN